VRNDIEEAVRLLRSEDPNSMERALALLQETVFSFSMRVCNQREDAEDTMQEVLVKSVPVLPKFESPKALIVWLYKVAKNRCLMSRRKSKFAPKHELSLEELMPDRSELAKLSDKGMLNPESFAIRSQEAIWLRAAIQKLPPQYRIILVLRDMEGLSDDEVAEIAGLRPGTVRVRLHRARLFVRKGLMKRLSPGKGERRNVPAYQVAEIRPQRCKAMFAELSNYLDEQLDDSLCEKLEKHMEGCEPCKAFLSSLQATIEECRNTPADAPRPTKAAKLRQQILASYQQLTTLT
jgi:RNA polymerase sigma-70 factor (ECF subfamily)